jgi:hypothetical protein
MKRIVLLVTIAALVVVLTAPSAVSQTPTKTCGPGPFFNPSTGLCEAAKSKAKVPSTGGILPVGTTATVVVLLMGAGALSYAVVRRR